MGLGPWTSPFELLLPHCPPSDVARRARVRGGSRFKVGLIIRVRDQRIRARCNDLSRSSTAPLLTGSLVPHGAGTRIEGAIRWTNVIAAPIGLALVSLVCLGGALSFRHDNPLWVSLFAVISLAFGWLGVREYRGLDEAREYEEQRLRDGLLAALDLHR